MAVGLGGIGECSGQMGGRRRSWRVAGLLLASGFVVATVINLVPQPPSYAADPSYRFYSRRLQQLETNTAGSNVSTTAANASEDSLFPTDAFTMKQRRSGAVVLHILGMIYMFCALALVCDEFFVPSLDVITEKLKISEDVAGATFMAAGGSAPELFTSIIGVFIAKNDVGIGTIVGSAVFNILFVIAMCVIFSRTVLELTWWPLFRDVTFYSIGLLMVVQVFNDNLVYWWEALMLFLWYIFYCTFMKFNAKIERAVKSVIPSKKVGRSDQVVSKGGGKRRPSTPNLHNGSKFRQGLLQLMIHTIDPLHAGKLDDQAAHLHAIASLNVLLEKDGENSREGNKTTQTSDLTQPECSTAVTELSTVPSDLGSASVSVVTAANGAANAANGTTAGTDEDEEEAKPLDLSWPDTLRKQLMYIIVAPIILVLWLTLPDCRSSRGRRYYIVTFLGSIVWIAIFSYLMVWWASVMSDTMRIPPEVVGLTILAAGTSVPDLITSVIVARKGFGDMAVSSSVGSNLFDICVGLPVPWLLDSLVKVFQQLAAGKSAGVGPSIVKSDGMTCSILMLFAMLILILITIAAFRWRMNKGLGIVMFLLYFVYLAFSLSFELGALKCYI